MAMAPSVASRPTSPAPSQLPPVPASPSVFSLASTTNPLSSYALPIPPPRPAHAVITKADLERSQEAYADLLTSAKAYRLALAALSTAASTLGSALEACARLKEARAEPIGPAGANPGTMSASFTASKGACTADILMSASGVHQLVANHTQILSETVYRSFEVPLLHDLDKWHGVIDDEEETYQQNIKAQSREVKRLEKEGLKLHKQRRRDVARFRAHLVELTRQLDGLTALHSDHARTLLRESQDTSGRIVDASCSLVRAEVDIFESLARKGWSGGGLDDLLEKGQDLFAAEDDNSHHSVNGVVGGDGVKLFSILPPKSILADSSASAAPGPENSLLIEATDRYQSLAGAATATGGGTGDRKQSSGGGGGGGGGDSESVFSADFNKPRGARPFSPQPIRRPPTDVTYDTLSGGGAGEPSALLLNLEDDIPSMTANLQDGDDVEDGQEEDEAEEEEEDEEEEEVRERALEEVDERESVLTNEDSAHWESHDPNEEVYHLRRRRTTQDSGVSALLMGGRGKMMRDGDEEEGARALGVEPSPESAWGSPGKGDFAS